MFTGRKKELDELKSQFDSEQKSVVLLYGKRGAGKSTFIAQAAKSFDGLVINHLCARTSLQGNILLLNASISGVLGGEPVHEKTTDGAVSRLKNHDGKILLVINEYHLFRNSGKEGEADSILHAMLQDLPQNIKVLLCESYIPAAVEMLEPECLLCSDFTLTMRIREFGYREAAEFYSRYGVRDKIQFYSVFGGSAYVLDKLDYWKSLEDNVIRLLLDRNGVLRIYVEHIVLDGIQKYFDMRILQILADGKKRYTEILDMLEIQDSGLLDKQLKILLGMDVIRKEVPVNRTDDRKKQFYGMNDSLLRFYFLFVFGRESQIFAMGEKKYYRQVIAPRLEDFFTQGFRNIVCEYFAGKPFGAYWHDGKSAGERRLIECVMETDEGYELSVVNYRKKPMSLVECQTAEAQIRKFLPEDFVRLNFVCSAGFSFEGEDYRLLSAKDIYS